MEETGAESDKPGYTRKIRDIRQRMVKVQAEVWQQRIKQIKERSSKLGSGVERIRVVRKLRHNQIKGRHRNRIQGKAADQTARP